MKRILFALCITVLGVGCSDSTSTPPSQYPLQLAELSPPYKPGGGSITAYSLQVSKNGSLVKGAKLLVTGYPSGKSDTVKFRNATLLSDSAGAFTFEYDWGTSLSLAFQAVKDSLVSNYVKY